jgi:serine/threonine-protein kinase
MLDVVGKNKDEAKKLLTQYGITQIRFENVYTSKEDDIVISQSVEKGEMINKDTVIVLSINVHADTNVMPLLIGKTAEEADAILNESNISSSDIVWEDLQSFYPQGMVIAQSVAPGEEIVKGGKTIKLTKSVEVESLRIAKLTGMTLEEATNWLQVRGIPFKVRDQVDQNAENGVIVSQSVPMFSEISRGQEVIIYKNVYVAFETESSEGTD